MLVEVSLRPAGEDAYAPVPWGCQLMGDLPVSVFPHPVRWQGWTEGNAGDALGAVNWLNVICPEDLSSLLYCKGKQK